MSLRKQLVHAVLIAVLGFLAYSNTLHSPFQLDDKSQLNDNPVIKDLKNFPSEIKGYNYNPRRFIGYLSFTLNYHFGGFDVVGYHIVNLLIHIGNSLLVYLFVLLTFNTPSMLQSTDSSPPAPFVIALFSALLFVSHPLQTQAVTYVIQRFTSLATFFYLFSMVVYIKGRLAMEKEDDNKGRFIFGPSLFYYLVSLVSAICAMKTKEIAFTLPIMILLYEFTFFKSALKRKLVFLIPVLLTLAIVPISVLHTDKPLGEVLSDLSEITRLGTDISRGDYLITQMRVIATYIRLIFLPINQNLDYDYPVYHSLFTPSVFLSFLLLLSIFGLGVYLLYKARRAERQSGDALKSKRYALCAMPYAFYRLTGFCILWFFITLSVESSIIPIVDVIFEHRLYLPLAGVFIGITSGVLVAAKRLQIEKIVMPVFVLITLLLSGVTYARNNLWSDEISLWKDVVEKSPNKARPHNNLGFEYAAQGMFNRAIEEYLTALRLKPEDAEVHYNLGVAYEQKGLTDMAVEQYQIAALAPGFAKPHNNLGVLYAKKALLDEAIEHFQTAIKFQPTYAIAHSNLGNAYEQKGLTDMAIEQYQIAVRLDPDNNNFRNELSKASR